MGGGLIIGEATDGLTYGVRVDTDGRLVTTSLFTEIAKGNVGDAAGGGGAVAAGFDLWYEAD
jgi:hypothetical protein